MARSAESNVLTRSMVIRLEAVRESEMKEYKRAATIEKIRQTKLNKMEEQRRMMNWHEVKVGIMVNVVEMVATDITNVLEGGEASTVCDLKDRFLIIYNFMVLNRDLHVAVKTYLNDHIRVICFLRFALCRCATSFTLDMVPPSLDSPISNFACDVDQFKKMQKGSSLFRTSCKKMAEFMLTTRFNVEKYTTHFSQMGLLLQGLPSPPSKAQLFERYIQYMRSYTNSQNISKTRCNNLLCGRSFVAAPKTDQGTCMFERDYVQLRDECSYEYWNKLCNLKINVLYINNFPYARFCSQSCYEQLRRHMQSVSICDMPPEQYVEQFNERECGLERVSKELKYALKRNNTAYRNMRAIREAFKKDIMSISQKDLNHMNDAQTIALNIDVALLICSKTVSYSSDIASKHTLPGYHCGWRNDVEQWEIAIKRIWSVYDRMTSTSVNPGHIITSTATESAFVEVLTCSPMWYLGLT